MSISKDTLRRLIRQFPHVQSYQNPKSFVGENFEAARWLLTNSEELLEVLYSFKRITDIVNEGDNDG